MLLESYANLLLRVALNGGRTKCISGGAASALAQGGREQAESPRPMHVRRQLLTRSQVVSCQRSQQMGVALGMANVQIAAPMALHGVMARTVSALCVEALGMLSERRPRIAAVVRTCRAMGTVWRARRM